MLTCRRRVAPTVTDSSRAPCATARVALWSGCYRVSIALDECTKAIEKRFKLEVSKFTGIHKDSMFFTNFVLDMGLFGIAGGLHIITTAWTIHIGKLIEGLTNLRVYTIKKLGHPVIF